MATKGIQNLHNALKEQGLQADITVDDMLYMIETDERFARAVHRGMAKNYNNIGDADSFYSKLGITYAKPKAVEETATINAEIQPTEAETPVVATPKVETPVAEIQPTAPVAEPKEQKTPAQILAQTKEKTTSNNANSAPATDESMLAKEQEIMQAQAQAVAPQTTPVAEVEEQAENTQSVAEEQPMAQTSSIDRQFSTEAEAPYDTTQAEQPIEDPEQAEQPQVAEETTEEQAQTEQTSARKVFLADGENIAQTEIVREDADNYYVLDDAGKEMPINKTYGNQFFDSYDQAKEFNNQFSLEAEGLAERILASANESKSSNQAVNDIIINSSGYKQLQGNDFGEWAFGETQAYAADSDNASPMSVAVISEYIPLVAPVASTVKQLQRLAKHEDGGKVYQELYHAVKSVGETYALAKTDADYNKINQNLAKRVEGIRMTAYAEAVLDSENFAKAKEEIAKWTNADDPDKVDMPETNKALLIVDTMKRSLSWSAEHPELADYNPYKNWDRYINNPEAQNNVGYDIDNIEWALSNIEPTTLKQWLSRSGKHDESAWADASYKIFNARMGENAFGLQMNVGAYLNQEDAWMAGLLNNAGIKDIDHYIHNAWFDELYDAVKPQLLTVYKNEADAKQLVRNFVTGRQVSKVFNSEYDQDDYLNFLKEFGSNKGRYNMAMSKIDEPKEIERMFNEDQRSYDYAVSFYQAAKERNEKAKANLEQMNNGHDWLRLLGLVEPHMIAYRIGRNTLDWLKGQDETSINEKVSDIITDYEENGKQKGLFGHVTYQSAGLWNYFNQQYNESANNYWVSKVETIEDTALPMVVDFAIGTKGLALLGKGAVKLAQATKLANYYQQLKKGSRILRTASVLYAKNPAFRVAGKAFTHMGRASIAALAMPGTYMYDNSTKAVNINPETGEAQAVDVDPMTFGEKYLEQAGAYLFFNELGAYSKGLVQGTMSASTKGLRKLLTHGSAERKALYQAGDLKTFAQEFKTAYGEAVKGIHKGGLQQTASLFGAYGAIPMVTHDLTTSIIKGDEDMLKHMLTPDYYTDLAVTCLFMELGTFQLHGKAIKGIKTLAWNGSARADWSKIDATTRQRYEENLIDKSLEKQSEYISQEANRIRQIADENVRKQEAEVLSKAINYALVENARRGAEQIGVHTNMFSLSRLKAIDAIVEGTMTRYTANENAHIAELPVAKGWKKHTNEEVCVVTLADGQRAECVVVGREVRTDGQYNQNVVRIEMQAKSKKASKEAKGKGKAKDADKILSIAVDPNSVEVPYVDGRKTFVIETTEKGAELKEAEVKSIDGENVTVIVDGKVHGIKRIDLYTDAYIALESAKALDAKIKADKAIVEMDSPKEIVAVTDADIKAEPQIATATEARVEAPEVEASHIRIEDKLAPGLVRDAHTETLAEADLVDKVAKKLGLSVRFVDAVDGGVANAKIEGNRVEIERNNPNPIKFLLGHELLHKIRTTSPEAYDAFVESARKAIPEFDKRVQMTRTAYQKADMKISNANAREEVFADFAGEMARDGKLLEKFIGESSPTLWQVLRDYYRKVKDFFTGKEYSDYERAEQALTNALNSIESAELADTNTKYSLRTDPAPKKTGIGYKVFVLKDGKLYPPMVANLDRGETPVGVWLDADAAPVAGESKTGRPQVKAGGKGTQGGSGVLAYRPGWHLGDIPYALQFNRKNPETGERELFPNNFVWAEVEYAADKDYQKEAESYGYNKNGNYQHSLAGLPRLPKDGAYRYRTNPLPETDPWIITGAMKVNRILKPSEVDAIVREAGREPQPRQADAVTDKQVAELNAELGLGTPTRYSLKREPNTETITDTATATAESLGVKVAIINDATREFKGAFNPKTGEIEINTAFATSEADVQQTVVHEVIGHGGIQAIAGDKFAEWCQQAYDSMSPESRKQTSARHKGITDAKEIGAEYMADLAMGEVINPSLWQRMVGNIRLRLRQLGIDMNLTDADIRYMLYSAHKMADKGKLQDSINHATTLAQLKEKAEQSHDIQEDFLSRPLMQVDPRLAPLSRGKYGMTDMQVMTTKEYTDLLRQTRLAEANDKSLGSRFSTTFIDSTLPIAEFVKSVYELDSINDAYTYDAENNPHIGANTARSKAAYRVAKFGDNHRQGIARNMNEQYQALMKANSDWSYDYVEALRRLYCVAKTGLERNQKVQAREALKEKGKGHPRTDFAGITGAMKWLGIVMTDWKGKKLNSIDWELEAKLLGKRNADQLTTAQVKRILAQRGFPKIEDFVTWYESMVGNNIINDFWWRMSRASHEVLRNQLESGLLSTESYQRLRWGETFFDRLVREGLNPADIEGARYLTHPNELVDRGWITQEVADSFAPYYQYYLPLQGSVDIQQKNVINYDYRERRESKKAVHEIKGHKQMVLDPVYRFFENATKAIHNEEQNRWLRQLLNVVREHEANAKNDALAIATKTYVDANGKPFFRKDANGNYITDADGNYITTPTLAEIKSGQAIEVKRELDVFDNMKTQAELIDQHRVIVYEDGTPISMLFADKSIAQAVYDKPAVFRSKDPLKVGDFEVSLAAVGNGINKINRWQSMMFTSKNPMFMIPNIVRDAQGGLQYNLMQGGNQWQLYSQIIFNQKVRQDVWAEIKNRTNGYYSSKSQYGSYVQEFFENGGQTAFTEVASLDAIREDMQRTIKDFEDSAVLRRGETSSQAAMRIAKKGWRVYNEWIERQGMASELMARVATYIAARENNKSIERAIYEAKECSVNFDRKGKGNYRRWYGVFGTFLNAAFQACRREKTLWRTGGATKYLAYRIIKPIVARTLSAGMSYMYYAMDNETSDDEKSFYDWARMYFSQDTHVANANYLFPVLGNDRGSLSIPNAMDDIVWDKAVWLILKRACLGYNAEESVGDDIMEVLSQAVDMTGTNPVSRFVGTFTPAPAFKGEDFTLGDRVLYSAGANPTLAPFAEAYVNADYKGSRLYFEQRDQNDIKPDSSRDLNKYSWGHQIAVALNELSGGTDYDAGWIDLQGSTIQSIFSATGGVYDFVRRSIDMGKEIYHAANDVATTHYGEERVADLADILVAAPIVSRFAKQPISRYEQMAIMDHSRGIDDEVEQWSKQVADAFKEGDSHRAANILNDVVESYRSADYMLALGRQNATSTYYSARSAEIKAYIDNLANQSYYNTELDVSAQANIIIGRALLWAKCVGGGASGSALENIKADDSAGLLYSIYKYAIPERRKIIKALATADDANKEQYLNALAKLEQTIVDKFNSVDEVDYLPERKTEEDYNQ